jgi:hypothetical protein
MMTTDQLKDAHNLMQKIEKAEHHLGEYRAAAEVIVTIPNETQQVFMRSGRSEVRLTGEEVGSTITAALECRLAAMRDELRKLGVA